jgi:hypothetical protein
MNSSFGNASLLGRGAIGLHHHPAAAVRISAGTEIGAGQPPGSRRVRNEARATQRNTRRAPGAWSSTARLCVGRACPTVLTRTCWPCLTTPPVILGQVDVEAKTTEIPMFATLLDRIGLARAVVTAGALRAQRVYAQYLVAQRGAHYLIAVRRNRPGLHAQFAVLPWRRVPAGRELPTRGSQATGMRLDRAGRKKPIFAAMCRCQRQGWVR